MRIKISSDSTCDLSQELIEKYKIDIIPLYIVKNGKDYRDTIEITPEDVYANAESGGQPCSTAAVNVEIYSEFFAETLKEYDAIVHFTISSEMSTCYQNAMIAAGDFENVYPIDSRNLSTGIGQLVLDAAIMAEEGVPAAEIADIINAKREKLDVSFVIDTLDYLRRGGRCSAVAAIGANLLSLKPCIEVKNGKMGVGKKYRGKLEKCIMQYVRERLEGVDDLDLRRIFITDSGRLSDELREQVKQEILKYQPFEEVLMTRAGCTVSNHCGPKTLGILYYHK